MKVIKATVLVVVTLAGVVVLLPILPWLLVGVIGGFIKVFLIISCVMFVGVVSMYIIAKEREKTRNRMSKNHKWIAFCGVVFFAVHGAAAARTSPPPPMVFPDGSTGSAATECGLGDLCAALRLPNGDTISVYNGGAANCDPFKISVVRTHGDTVLFRSNSRSDDSSTDLLPSGRAGCYNFKNTYLTFDDGQARLGLFLSHDGSLFAEWNGGKSDVGGAASSSPSPSPAPSGAYLHESRRDVRSL